MHQFAVLQPRLTVLPPSAAQAVYGSDTGTLTKSLAGALRIHDADCVAGVIAIANEHKIPLWPVSGARNFGYGTALPVEDGTVILDLSSLKGI